MRWTAGGIALLLMVVSVAPPGESQGPLDNDAGSGRDAPNAPMDIIRIVPGRTYQGNLTTVYSGILGEDTRDYYSLVAADGQPFQSAVFGAGIVFSGLVRPDGSTLGASSYFGSDGALRLDATLDMSGIWFLGFQVVNGAHYRFRFALEGYAGHPLGPRPSTPLDNDAGSGRDAPDGLVDRLRITPGRVYEANLTLVPDEYSISGNDEGWDTRDTFSFEGWAGQTAQLAYTSDLVCLRLHRPDATPHGPPRCSASLPGPPPLNVLLDQDGVWLLTFTPLTINNASYRFALGLNASAPGPFPTGPAATQPQNNDAGSGRDAPSSRAGAIPILPFTVYQANLSIGTLPIDLSDWFAFEGVQNQSFDGKVQSTGVLCMDLIAPSGATPDFACTLGPQQLTSIHWALNETGTWYLSADALGPQLYRFAFGLDGEAPDPLLPPLLTEGDGSGTQTRKAASQPDEHVVIAVVDTGINPYHEFFRAPDLVDPPSNWLPGFPEDALPIHLSFGAATVADALAADATEWDAVERSTYDAQADTFETRLYTFPGTRVVGAVSFGEYSRLADGPGTAIPIYDDHGHGTHSASLAAGADLPVVDDNVLVVMVEVDTFDDGVRWAARQPWIDAVSLSAGVVANAPVTFGPLGFRDMQHDTHEVWANGKPMFMASGNGVSGSGVTPDHCTTYTSPFTGPPWVTRIGAAESSSDNPSYWHCLPVDVVGRTSVDAPDHASFSDASFASGTSAAAPSVAGAYGQLLLDAKRTSLPLSRHEVLSYLLNDSRPAPTRFGVFSEPSHGETAFMDQGFGLAGADALARARVTLLGGGPATPRPEMDTWRRTDEAIRESLWGVGSPTWHNSVSSLPQDDAGTGRDASNEPAGATEILPGVVYSGIVTSYVQGDHVDWYAFDGTEGSVLEIRFAGAWPCVVVVSPSGTPFLQRCAAGTLGQTLPSRFTMRETGTWLVRFSGDALVDSYRFAFRMDGTAPTPFP